MQSQIKLSYTLSNGTAQMNLHDPPLRKGVKKINSQQACLLLESL
jgi:hypothetical protein